MSFLDRVHQVIAEKSLLKHPFYVAWTQGKLTVPMLREYAKQYYHHEASFPRYLSAIHTNCSDLPIRQVILGNMMDEEMGDKNHPQLWRNFAKSLGLSEDEVKTAEKLSETEQMVENFHAISRNRSTAEALAAMYAYEYQIPEIARTKIEGLKKWYGISDVESLEFFTVHEKADEWHSEQERNVFSAAANSPEMENHIVQSVSDACDALNLLLDGVWKNYCEKELGNACVMN